MKLENRYAPPPVVTDEEVNEHACTLAKAEGCRDSRLFNLLRWPIWASTPPAELLLLYGKEVEEYRKQSRARLEVEAAAQPRIRIKRPPSRRRVTKPPSRQSKQKRLRDRSK